MSDRIAVFNKGRIQQMGTPSEIYDHPANDFVAGFVGTMNRISGHVVNGVLNVHGGETSAHLKVGGPNRATTLCFRPEAARLVSANGAISARVAAATFFGATQRIVADVSPECRLQLDLPSNLSFMPGQILACEIDPAAILEFGARA